MFLVHQKSGQMQEEHSISILFIRVHGSAPNVTIGLTVVLYRLTLKECVAHLSLVCGLVHGNDGIPHEN